MLQTPSHHDFIVLCLEDIHSHFAASQQIFDSGTYEVVAATSLGSALIALKAIRRISAAVLDSASEMESQEHFRRIADINAARPGLPQIIVAPPPPIPPPDMLNVAFVESVLRINAELQHLLASSRSQFASERQFSAQLRDESRRVRKETMRLRSEAARMRQETLRPITED